MASTRFIFLAAIVCLLAITSLAKPAAPIIGGEDAKNAQFAYVASLRWEGAHICGGSIIDGHHILTAAHCVAGKDIKTLSVRVGSVNQFAGGKLMSVKRVSVHPDYVKFSHDIAIVELTVSLVWSDKIAPIAYITSAAEEPSVNAVVTVAGWGEQSETTSAYKLHHTSFTVADDDTCTDAYDGNDESVLCLAHELKVGSCTGDAGNSAVYNNKIVAVSSFVVGTCGSRYPEVFASVAHYASWIQETIA